MVEYNIVNDTGLNDNNMILENFVVESIINGAFNNFKLTDDRVEFVFGNEKTPVHYLDDVCELGEAEHLSTSYNDDDGNLVHQAIVNYTGIYREGLVFNVAYALALVLADQYCPEYVNYDWDLPHYDVLYTPVVFAFTIALIYSISAGQAEEYTSYCINTIIMDRDNYPDIDREEHCDEHMYMDWRDELIARLVCMNIFEVELHNDNTVYDNAFKLIVKLKDKLNTFCRQITMERKLVDYEQCEEIVRIVTEMEQMKFMGPVSEEIFKHKKD